MKTTGRPSIAPVLLVNFIGTLGFSIVIPFLVFLVTRFGGNALVYGVVGAAYPAFQLIGAPLLGAWSDRFGRRRILLLSQTGTLLSWLVFAAAFYLPMTTLVTVDSRWWGSFSITVPLLLVFVARALDGLTGGNISVANAYLADISDDRDRARNFGRMGISSNLGFILGPAIASLLGALSDAAQLPVFAALLISLGATVLIAVALPESRPLPPSPPPARRGLRRTLGQEPVDCTRVKQVQSTGFAGLIARRPIRRLLWLYFLVFLGFNLFYVSFPVRAVRDLDWTVGQTGVFFSVMSLLLVLVQGPVLSRLSRIVPERRLIVFGAIALALNFALLISTDRVVIYTAVLFFALGNGTMWPSLQSVLSRTAGDALQGATQGAAGAVGGLASVIGLLAGGLLYDRIGAGTFIAAGGMMLLVAVFTLMWRTDPPAESGSADGRLG